MEVERSYGDANSELSLYPKMQSAYFSNYLTRGVQISV